MIPAMAQSTITNINKPLATVKLINHTIKCSPSGIYVLFRSTEALRAGLKRLTVICVKLLEIKRLPEDYQDKAANKFCNI